MTKPHHFRHLSGADHDGILDSSDIVVMSFSRREVENGLTGSAVDRLLTLADTAARVRRFAGAVVIQFKGYDDDPREIAQIPDARAFFQAVSEQFCWWMHFLNPDPEANQIPLAIALLTPIEPIEPAHGMNRFHMRSEDLVQTISRLFTAIHALHAQHGYTAEQTDAIEKPILRLLEQAYGGP